MFHLLWLVVLLINGAVGANYDLQGRITNGFQAKDGQVPWQVGLDVEDMKTSWWCGGSIIANRWVLTAAHCTENALRITLHFGSNFRGLGSHYQNARSVNIYDHPKFKDVKYGYDISLIKLNENLNFSPKLRAIKLPPKNSDTEFLINTVGTACGWGRNEKNKTVDKLACAELTIIDPNECKFTYQSQGDILCAETLNGISTCEGDSGGPLTAHFGPAGVVQVGITSYGTQRGCTLDIPVAFTDVAAHMDFIEETTGIKFST